MHICLKEWSISYIYFLWDHDLSFGDAVSTTFSIFNNILSIKCWQFNQGSLKCFETVLVDEIQKSGNHRCGWKGMDSRDRQIWAQLRIQLLLTMWPWESFLTLRVKVSYLWYKKHQEHWGLAVRVLTNIPHLLGIFHVFICAHAHLHCTRCCVGNRRPLLAFALRELKMLLVEHSTSPEIMGET